MSLADRLTKPAQPLHGYPCSVGALYDQLQGAELKAFEQMMGDAHNRGWVASAIHAAVTAEGYSISLQQINRHRGLKCRCFKDGQ